MNLKLTKRIAAIGLAALMSGCMIGNPGTVQFLADNLTLTANAVTASGTCGTGLAWSLNGDTLTITGTGTTIPNYGTSSSFAPWKAYASDIKKVILPPTLKVIGNAAFYKMSALEYVYTKNGSGTLPCFPDLTKIGDYVFSECYNFRGNTSNGNLTFGLGTQSVMESGSLTIGKQSFRNCDKVRFLHCKYSTVNAAEKCFYHMNLLQSVNFGDTTAQLGKNAFLDDSRLSSVNIKPSVLPIHNTAFDGTYYKGGSCTQYFGRDFGAATTLTGKQLVVNFFVDRTIVDLKNVYSESRKECFRPRTAHTLEDGEIAAYFYTQAPNCIGVYDRDEMVCTYSYGWNPQRGSRTDNSAITLNKLDFGAQDNPNAIPVDTAEDGVTPGFFGSYVNSADITQRLNDVRAAMNDLQSQAAEYGASFTYEMHPETNFQITYDKFDWTTIEAVMPGQNGASLGYDMTRAYMDDDNDPQIREVNNAGTGITHITGSSSDELFTDILSASQQLTGSNAHEINLLHGSNGISPYTEYLKSRYNVDSVIYLVHINTPSQSMTYHQYQDEFSVICAESSRAYSQVSRTAEHEIAHLFSADDYYQPNVNVPAQVSHFAYTYFGHELMLCDSTDVSPVTAFALGWLRWLDTSLYDVFYG